MQVAHPDIPAHNISAGAEAGGVAADTIVIILIM